MTNASLLRDKKDNVLETATNTFPYLNLEFFWNADGKLELKFHWKLDQKLKYLNKVITHTNVLFRLCLVRA